MNISPSASRSTAADQNVLEALAAPSLDPLFWKPASLDGAIQDLALVPFLHWLVSACAPPVILDLCQIPSTAHDAFCRAAARSNTKTRCHALSPLADDGFQDRHRTRYGETSALIKPGEERRAMIREGCLALLHVDLDRGYEFVRRALAEWSWALSDDALLLVRGTRASRRGAANRTDWDALVRDRAHFEFAHGDGLGVIALGTGVPKAVAALCNPDARALVERIEHRIVAIAAAWCDDANTRPRLAEARLRAAGPESGDADEMLRWRMKAREEERARFQIAQRLTIARHDLYTAAQRTTAAETRATAAETRATAAETRATAAEMRATAAETRATAVEAQATERRNGRPRPINWRKVKAALAEFDQAYYYDTYPDVLRHGQDALKHYVRLGWREGRRPSAHFDTNQYMTANANVRGILQGEAETGTKAAGPNASARLGLSDPMLFVEFDETFYLASNPDVAERGMNPLLHYIVHGWREGRRPAAAFDTAEYIAANSRVRAALMKPRARGVIKLLRRLQSSPPTNQVRVPQENPSQAPEPQLAVAAPQPQGETAVAAFESCPPAPERATSLDSARLTLLNFLTSNQRIVLGTAADPILSIVLALPADPVAAYGLLTALPLADAPPFEVFVVRGGVDDKTDELLSRLEDAHVCHIADDETLLQAFNLAAAKCCGKAILFLHEARLRTGTITAGLAGLKTAGNIGAVGGRVVLASGRLRDAGAVVWSDATLGRYAAGLLPEAGAAMFRHEVDFCDLPLFVSREAWEQAGRFDPEFEVCAYGLADFALRLRWRGWRVVHDPNVISDLGSNADLAANDPATRRSRVRLKARHEEALRVGHLAPVESNLLFARAPRRADHRTLLMIDNEVPFGSLGSGYPRAKAILAEAAAVGWAVTLFPLHRTDFDWVAARAEIAPEIEIIHRRGHEELAAFLLERRGYYDAILVSRPDNMELTKTIFKDHPDTLGGARLIYDAEAVFAYREAIRAELEGRPFTEEQTQQLCFEEAQQTIGADGITCVSEAEADFFRTRSPSPVYVLNHPVVPLPSPRDFSAREGFLFVGRLLDTNSPNWQGLRWFVQTCWPLIRAALPNATLTVVGYVYHENAELQSPGVRLLGPVADLEPCYAEARVFVAPVQFAAGVPIKIIEAAASGLPVAATRLMARQLSWQIGHEIVAEDDPQALANGCVNLHQDKDLWRLMRDSAATRIRQDFSPEQFRENLKLALNGGQIPQDCPAAAEATER